MMHEISRRSWPFLKPVTLPSLFSIFFTITTSFVRTFPNSTLSHPGPNIVMRPFMPTWFYMRITDNWHR